MDDWQRRSRNRVALKFFAVFLACVFVWYIVRVAIPTARLIVGEVWTGVFVVTWLVIVGALFAISDRQPR